MQTELKVLIDSLPGLVWTADLAGRAEFINQRWLDYTGLRMDQAVGHGFHAAIHPDDLPLLLESWEELLEAGTAGGVDARLRRHDGEYRRFSFNASPIRDSHGRILKWCGICSDIEDRTRAEQRRSIRQITEAQRLSQTGSFTADLWADQHEWSEELYRIFEIEAGTPISSRWIAGRIHGEDREAYLQAFEEAVAGRATFDHFCRIESPGGTVKYLHIVARYAEQEAERPVYIGAIRDITESKLAEDALRSSEAELLRTNHLLTEAQRLSKTGSFVWDVYRDIHVWSEEIYRMFGFDPDAPASMSMIQAQIHPEDMPLVEAVIGRAREGKDFEAEFRVYSRDGELKHLRVIAHRMEPFDDNFTYVGAIQDFTLTCRSAEALTEARNELARVARVSAMNMLTASIAHEVNQPLTGILTNATTCLRMLAADPPDWSGARSTAERTIRDATRAASVIQRLRDMFTRGQPRREPVDLNLTALHVHALVSEELRRAGVTFRPQLAEDLPLVLADPVQIQQVVMNLVLNAVEAMEDAPHGPRELLLSTSHEHRGEVTLSVRDTGVGFTTSHSTMFEAFYSTKAHGMGVGLSVSRLIIEAHEGRIWGEDNQGPGATMAIALPIAQDAPRPGDEPRSA